MGAGVYRYDTTSDKFTNFTMQDGLNDNNIESVFEDKAGNIWFGTAHGVCRYDGKTFTDITTKESLCKFDINCILEDKNGNFWFGTNGYGVCCYNPSTSAITHFTMEQGLGSNAVQCIFEDKSGNLWLGERAGGVCRYDTTSSRFTQVNGEGYLSSQIMSIIQDKTGNIWFVNLYNGLCRYDGKSYTHFTKDNGLCNDTITSIYADKKENLWLGSDAGHWDTGSAGLCRYNPTTGVSTHFSEKDGITKSNVWTILEENDGTIWVGTKGGLYRYHSPSGKFIEYTYKVNN
jgi:ligand-binding sensor domain-containing protein